jgi:hypothetical protein
VRKKEKRGKIKGKFMSKEQNKCKRRKNGNIWANHQGEKLYQ